MPNADSMLDELSQRTRKLLLDSLKYIGHTKAEWVSYQPHDWNLRGKQGYWVGVTCASIDPFDQSGDWRCNCGSDKLRAEIRKFLGE